MPSGCAALPAKKTTDAEGNALPGPYQVVPGRAFPIDPNHILPARFAQRSNAAFCSVVRGVCQTTRGAPRRKKYAFLPTPNVAIIHSPVQHIVKEPPSS